MRFFNEGDRYQDQYLIESTMDFFDGELAIARLGDQRFYLQFAPLKKQAPPRSIQQYLAMDHPLVLPYLQLFTEERALVFIRPFVEIRPLLDIVVREPMDEDRVVGWVKSLLQLESLLAKQPLSMYLLSEPQNLGLTPEGDLKVIYCGVNQVTQLESTLDWGTLIYILLSGEIPEQPVANVLSELPVSKPMERLLQRSIKSRSTTDLLSLIDSYEKKKNSKGLLGRLFRTRSYGKSVEKAEKKNTKGKKKVTPPQQILKETIPEADPSAEKKHLEGEQLNPSEAERLERERLEAERLERERLEAERLERERLEAERLELERLEAERLKRERLEAERLERERLEAERLERERLEAERRERERLEAERLERERLEAERRERERLEAERLERERLEAERLERERLEAERRERELARREKEREQRNLLIRQRMQLEYEEHERLARQFEEYAKQVFYR